MPKIVIEPELCKGCLFCVGVCPKKVIGKAPAVNAKGYQYVAALNHEDCIGCAICAIMCPDAVIEVYK